MVNADCEACHSATAEAASLRRRTVTSEQVLKFVSENQRLEGFSGQITEETATHQPDMEEIAQSAKRFNAQVPSPENHALIPLVAKFRSQKV
jgi:hypothetical protein